MRIQRALATVVATAALVAPATAAAKPTRDVLVVSNNWAGTADLVDPHTFKRLDRIDVVPDKAERVAEIHADPTRTFYFDNIRALVGEGHDQYVDDGFTSPDGRTVYFSRPSFADVVAISLRTHAIVWRTPVDGYRADHMALSQNGRRLLVSASTANVVDVLDTATGAKVGSFPAGDAPHENNYSRDGRRIFQASIGQVYTDTDDPSQDATKGRRVFEVVDARTLEVLKTYDMGKALADAGHPGMSAAVRPMAISPDERFVYFQVSFFFGIVRFDLRTERVTRVLGLPLGAAKSVPRTSFLLDSAHHGLAMRPDGSKLCVAGTMSRYAAIVRTRPFRLQRTVRVGRVPYWSAPSADGRYCFVSVAGEDRVAVISFRSGRQVARIKVGDHPQRMRTGVVRRAYVEPPRQPRGEPRLTVATAKLDDALHCTPGLRGATHTPIMIVTGTGASGAEAYGIGKPALDAYGAPVCYVDFPQDTTADLQVSVQYLVNGLRAMARRAQRQVAVIGISQGGLLPRVALTYWPSLRRRVSDVVAAAAPQHGTTVSSSGRCGSASRPACIPAAFQQASGSRFLSALNAQPDETPGPTAWTTTRSSGDETVQPQTGPHPTSALRGASNVLIQDVCPGRQVTHIGTVLDSVTFALADDAIRHRGPGRVSRLPAGVCSHPYAAGLDEAATTTVLRAAATLTSSRFTARPQVTREPKVRGWMKRRAAR